MTLQEFEHLLDLRGSNLGRWDGRERDAAQALLQGSEIARRLYQESCRLDEAIRSQTLRLDEQAILRRARVALRSRVAELPEPMRFTLGLPRIRWAQLGALACIAALAIALGWSVSDPADSRPGHEDMVSLLLRDNLEDPP